MRRDSILCAETYYITILLLYYIRSCENTRINVKYGCVYDPQSDAGIVMDIEFQVSTELRGFYRLWGKVLFFSFMASDFLSRAVRALRGTVGLVSHGDLRNTPHLYGPIYIYIYMQFLICKPYSLSRI